MQLRDATPDDAASIAAIYNHFVVHTTISFEELPVADAEMAARINGVRHAGLPWLVAIVDGHVAGYAYAAPWRVRDAYRFSVESSVYVAPDKPRCGLGRALYLALLERLRASDKHLIIAGIALPNEASIGLHESLSYKKVAHFSEVGYKFDRWLDVGYWQLAL